MKVCFEAVMAFKFNFSHNSSDEEKLVHHDLPVSSCTEAQETACLDERETNLASAAEVVPESPQETRERQTVEYKIGDLNLRVVHHPSDEVISPALSTVTTDSDLVPGVYEGGLKIWECGIDLAEFLTKDSIELGGMIILELGCGAGLPGITAIQQGAMQVHFQDYNAEVIQGVTIPNVQLNHSSHCKCRYFSGDWSSLPLVISPNGEEQRYDVILTAETIYNAQNYSKLHEVLDKLLKPDGIIYLAAKSTYFGVGGGTRLFEDFLKQQKVFRCETCLDIPAGVPREILKITRQES